MNSFSLNHQYVFISILICAGVTLFTRAFPFLFFRRGKKVPRFIDYLGQYLPLSVIAILVIYSIKDIRFTGWGGFIPHLSGLSVTVLLHLWLKNTIVSIGLGTALYMVLVNWVFV